MESNLQAVERAFREFSNRNIPAILEICSDDVTLESYPNPHIPFSGTFEGKEGVERFLTSLLEEVEYTAVTPREFFSQGETVVALGRHIGRVRRTGKTFDHDWVVVLKFRDSKVYTCVCFADTWEQAEAFQGSIADQRREVFPTPAATSRQS